MTENQWWGVFAVVVGAVIIVFRRFVHVRRDYQAYDSAYNTAKPHDGKAEDNWIVVVGGATFILGGVLYLLKILP